MYDHAPGPPPGDRLRLVGSTAIHLLDGSAPVRFAAEELVRYLPRLLPGAELELYLGPPGPALAAAGLAAAEPSGEETILIHGDGHRYVVGGGSPAAVLHAAYAFLESLGARWLKPGGQGEVLCPRAGPPPAISLASAPAFRWRGLADGCLSWWPADAPFDGWLGETRAMVDWMGKVRMNRLFVHFNRLPPGDLSPLLPELEKRGILLELGGHNLARMLPPGAREAEPDLCRLWQGQRRPDGNFCTANPRLLRLLQEGARCYAEALPSADLYHLWPYDAAEHPWCSCSACAGRSPAEQMWRAVSAAAEGLARVRPGAAVSGLLYHESLGGSGSAPEGVHLAFAPRERCYLHPMDLADAFCPRNRLHARQLDDALELRGDTLSVLEYYGDPILFGRPANRPGLVASDLAAYWAAGVGRISALVFGTLSWWLYPVQMYAYARGCWDPAAAGSAIDDYCWAASGDAGAERLARYYRLEGEASGAHLRFCGYGLDGSWATLPFPPPAPLEEARRHLGEMGRGEALLREAGGILKRSAASGDGLLHSALTAHGLEEAFHRAVVAQLARSLGEPGPDGLRALSEAVGAMESASPSDRGIFGTHWMLPWLRRCLRSGRPAAP